jgi:hypothetical protein
MDESIQGSDQHNRRLDDDLVREPADEEESTDIGLWDEPGRDGVVSESDGDPDRADLRSEIGRYLSRDAFPMQAHALITAAEQADASDAVLDSLRGLDRDARFTDAQELWEALGLASGPRF